MKHYGILFNRKKGTIVKTIEDKNGCGLLMMAGLNITKPSQDYVVFDTTGEIKAYYEGKKNDLPNICHDMVGRNIEELCEGLLEALESEN